ncbi:hypothetical protein [Streptomyces sp. NPDC051561]|uniref:hypothetical protein n=1 Tax=Streptomyces sp. NPDC051561 TaxID=3365658 RepID=UPI003792AE29
MKKSTLSACLLPAATFLLAGAAAWRTASTLAAYQVPLPMTLVCAFGVAVLFASVVVAVSEASRPVFRCRAEGCTYRVRVSHADAAEVRRWQESAAAHPDHEVPARS